MRDEQTVTETRALREAMERITKQHEQTLGDLERVVAQRNALRTQVERLNDECNRLSGECNRLSERLRTLHERQ